MKVSHAFYTSSDREQLNYSTLFFRAFMPPLMNVTLPKTHPIALILLCNSLFLLLYSAPLGRAGLTFLAGIAHKLAYSYAALLAK